MVLGPSSEICCNNRAWRPRRRAVFTCCIDELIPQYRGLHDIGLKMLQEVEGKLDAAEIASNIAMAVRAGDRGPLLSCVLSIAGS
jgi:hypothetical protein